jgi:hypothetical protein
MNLLARLFGWLWGTEAATPTPEEDRSSMADLVRLLSTDEPPSDVDAGPSDKPPLSAE